MGEVYRARDSKLKRDVAVKVLPALLTANPDALARFEREALAVAALSHPNILSIFDFGTHDGRSYAVMELLEGETLRGKLDAGPIPQRQAVDYAVQIARGPLGRARQGRRASGSEAGQRLRLARRPRQDPRLRSRQARRQDRSRTSRRTRRPDSGHTEPGTVMGTMGYMSPEQVRGLPVDHRTDIFSFGAILYELLSGRKAFKRNTASDTIAAILKEEPPELVQSGRTSRRPSTTSCGIAWRRTARTGSSRRRTSRSRCRRRRTPATLTAVARRSPWRRPVERRAPRRGGPGRSSWLAESASGSAAKPGCGLPGDGERRSRSCRSRTSARRKTTTSPTGSRTPSAAS